jgi:MoaA/NifB/PqqE/SkfB family radical SAM enzyme
MTVDWSFYHWHLEVSGKCTLRCPRCPRTEIPDTPWINKELDLEFVQRLFPPEFLQQHVQRITFCGDVGDPIYASEFLEIVDYLKTVKPELHIFIVTNGSYRKDSWWQQLAKYLNHCDTVNFSVDGYDHDSNNLYRRNSDWDSIMTGMKIMCKQSTAFVNWASIIFSFNQDRLDNIKGLATDIGCDGLQLTYSTKFGSKYGEAYQGQQDPLEPRSEFISKTHRYHRTFCQLSDRTQDISAYLDHNEKRLQTIQTKYQGQPITPMCEIGNRGMYVSADGILHPCSWVSFPYHSMTHGNKTIHYQDSFHQRFRSFLSLHTRTLSDIIADPLWQKLSSGWTNPEKTWVECAQKCSSGLVDREYAVQWFTN